MASKHLVVKATLQYPEGLELGCSPDIRRFKLARESAEDKRDLYCRLVDTLATIFPDIQGVDFSLFWKDGEGDLVEFTTMAELQAAIDAMSDHVLRVMIIVHFDDIDETTEAETEGKGDKDKASKRVRFARAGRKFRRRVRRRRRAALSDPTVISKEYRVGARILIRRLHQTDNNDEVEVPQQADTSLAELAPEVQQFIKQIYEEWHSKLSTQRPTVVARRMRMKSRTFPPSLVKDHFLWLLRLMGRWHRRHAGQCRAMAGWSSGDTEADESGGEETMMRIVRRKKKKRRKGQGDAKQGGGGGAGGAGGGGSSAVKGAAAKVEEEEEEGKSEQHNVSKEFRQAVRVMMKRVHRKNDKPADDQEKATLAALKPEVQSFLQKLADDWHAMLAEKKPRVVAKRMKKRKRPLPADLQRDHYLWLCRYFRRWHSRNAARCSNMAGWSSGEDEEHMTDYDDDDHEEDAGGKGKKKESSSSSSESDSDDEKKKKKKAVPKEFVKAARLLVNRLHNRKATPRQDDRPATEDEALLAALSPEARAFVQSFAEDWDQKMGHKSPLMVAKRMRRKRRELPAGIEDRHVQFLCRFLARWHCKHAAFCAAMATWSSGETGGETSGEERACLRRRARLTGALEVSTASEQEDTDCVETACKPVSKEFRTGVRQWLNQLHRKPAAATAAAATAAAKGGSKKPTKAKDDKEKTTLSPEVEQFLQRFAEAWHSKAASSRPRAVSREMKAEERGLSLPARMEQEQYSWLCCYMARWHRKHATKCDVISGGDLGEAKA